MGILNVLTNAVHTCSTQAIVSAIPTVVRVRRRISRARHTAATRAAGRTAGAITDACSVASCALIFDDNGRTAAEKSNVEDERWGFSKTKCVHEDELYLDH